MAAVRAGDGHLEPGLLSCRRDVLVFKATAGGFTWWRRLSFPLFFLSLNFKSIWNPEPGTR
jgi:hypothetical protein